MRRVSAQLLAIFAALGTGTPAEQDRAQRAFLKLQARHRDNDREGWSDAARAREEARR